jgi:hypothetical protein
MTGTSTSAAAGTGRTGITRPVLLAGITLGTCLTILAMWNGVRLPVPDLPPILGAALGAVIVWALFMAAAAVLSELTVRHHRAALAHGWQHGKRGGAAAVGWSRRAAQGAAVRSRPWRTRIVTAVQTRWAARGAPAELEPENPAGGNERICSGCGWGIPAGGTCPTCKAGRQAGPPDPSTGPTYSWGPADGPTGWPANDPETAHRWAQHMSTGGKPYVVTGYPPGGGPGRTVATYVNGKPSTEGVSSMPASPSRIKTEHRARRAAARSGGPVPSEWGPVIAQTADFEPEDDGELLEWMGRQVTGLSAWAEALVDFYDHATNTIGIDPTASAMLYDVADAAAQAAETMGAAKAKFTEHYELPREFAGNGGLMTHDGRWITGGGA